MVGAKVRPPDPLAGLEWHTIGIIEVDAATVAFGDGYVMERLLPIEPIADGPFDAKKTALVVQTTGEDCPVPLEVALVGEQRVAARMEFVNDVAELDGDWVPVGHITITRGRAVACDPFCHGAGYRRSFRLPRGQYVAEVFRHKVPGRRRLEALGLRIRLDER